MLTTPVRPGLAPPGTLAALATIATIAALAMSSQPAAAQDTPVRDTAGVRDTTALRDTTSDLAACTGQVVSAIVVDPEPPGMLGDDAPWWRRAVVNGVLQHVTTKDGVIRDLLRLKVGEPCTELERSESERILRAQPFIATASVRALPESGGRVTILVRTVDEIPAQLGGAMRGSGISAVTLGNTNVLGYGMALDAGWQQGFAFRDGMSAHFTDYHALHGPYTFAIGGRRAPLGSDFSTSLAEPFLTNLQHTAWHVGYSDRHGYMSFLRPGDEHNVSLGLRRTLWDVGGMVRVGPPSRRVFIGALATHERSGPAAAGVIITREGMEPDTTGVLDARYGSYESTRLGALLGVRLVSFMPVHGFDALDATQDLAKGVQLGLIAARGVRAFGGDGSADFFSGDLYGGTGTPESFLGARTEVEGQRSRGTGRWNAIVASGRLAWYLKSSEAETFIASGEFSGAWRTTLPFELALGDPEGGVRGYIDSRIAGSRRLVFRAENRWRLGTLTKFVRLGVAGFADMGSVWAGGVPFGQTSGMKGSVGVGLLAAIPQHSRQLLRLDLAVPVTPGAGGSWEIRFSVVNGTRTFWREPTDIGRARSETGPASILSWP
ncbi:MAG TPA: BamA/TamA family outer membrane protein [Gemmatimonadaceae bacterium]|nr:BamA/TamA family outer membrane protein [Gemmatimonadaceae bacterium]